MAVQLSVPERAGQRRATSGVACWRGPADPAVVAELRGAIARRLRDLRVGPALEADVRLAASELVANAVVHGYRGREGEVEVSLDRAGEELLLTVRDSGVGMSPNPRSPGAGLGLAIVGRMADRLHVRDLAAGGTEVVAGFAA